jgi:tol-pal system protein YbgF
MKRQHLFVVILAIGLSGSIDTLMAQSRWGLGVSAGANSIYGDLKKTSYGLGGEGYLTRRFNSHVGLTAAVGYNVLPFTTTIPALKTTAKFTTNAVRGDLMLDYEFASNSLRPYIGLGLGGINFEVTGKLNGAKLKSTKRFSNFDFGPSAGFRVMLGSRSAIDFGGNFRYTTGDGLDGAAITKAKDAIVAVRAGFTTFFGGGSSSGIDLLAGEQAPVEEAESSDLADFQQRVDQMETAPPQQPQDMQEYIRLKSRMDDLNQQIGQKEGEINTLRTALAEKNESVETLQTQVAAAPARSNGASASFSKAYEEALSQFYAKRYTEAISQFEALIAQFPDHSLASNCVYWIGEAHFGSGNYREAANAFNRVLGYPRSLKKDDALLMLGRAHLQLNQKEEARQAFDRLVKEFPTSEFVGKAEAWLSRM